MGGRVTTLYDINGNPASVYDTAGKRIWGPPVTAPDPSPALPMLDSYMRWAWVWDVAADGSRDYTTLTEAASAARSAEAGLLGHTRAYGWSSPYRAHLFRVWPGEYKEANWLAPTHFGLMGMGERPEDVRLWDDRGYAGSGGKNPEGQKSGENILNVAGKTVHVENVWLDHASDDPEWHSIRIVGPAGDAGRKNIEAHQAIFRDVRMTSAGDGMAGKCALDATTSRFDTTFHRVWFDTPGQPQAINLHPGNGRHLFVGCSITAGYDFIDDPTLPNNGRFADGTYPGAIPVGIHTHGNSYEGMELTWVETADSVWDVGRQAPDPSVPPRGGIALIAYNGLFGTYHIDADLPKPDPESPALLVKDGDWIPDPDTHTNRLILDRDTPTDQDADALAMDHRISKREREFYGADPQAAPPPAELIPGGTAGNGSLDAGTYWIAYDLPDVGVIVDKATYDLTSTGTVSVGTSYADLQTGAPVTSAAGGLYQGGVQAASGPASFALIPRWYYPGHKRVWVKVSLSAPTNGATTTAMEGRAYYAAPGATELVPVPEGQALPSVVILNRAY